MFSFDKIFNNQTRVGANLILFVVLMVLFSVLYYLSPLRSRVENKLFDLRSRFSPNLESTEKVLVVGVNLNSAAAKNDLLKYYKSLLNNAKLMQAKKIILFLPSQKINYNIELLQDLKKLKINNTQLFFALNNVEAFYKKNETYFFENKLLYQAILSADLTRTYRRSTIRDSQLNFKETKFKSIAETAYSANNKVENRDNLIYKINYFKPNRINLIDSELISQSEYVFKGKTIFVGLTSYLPYSYHHREATFVNTPWQDSGDDLYKGVPLIVVQAIIWLNFYDNIYLKPLHRIFVVFQSLIISFLSFIVWRKRVGVAALLFSLIIMITFLIHLFLFSVLNFEMHLADSLLFATIFTFIGTVKRLNSEFRKYSKKKIQLNLNYDLANIQDTFLNRYSFELSALNSKIKYRLMKYEKLQHGEGNFGIALRQTLNSSLELNEYLVGMQQFVAVNNKNRDLQISSQMVLPVILNLKKIFAEQLLSKHIALSTNINDTTIVVCDVILLQNILYNLLSNAIKFSNFNQRVEININYVKTSVFLSVRDYGVGIKDKDREHVFVKYTKQQNNSLNNSDGHGVGLYLSKYFANRMDAKLYLNRAVTEGCEFVLEMQQK